MSKGLNKQQVIGNLAGDAELVYVGEKNTPKCTFRVISTTGWGDYEHTEGFNVIVWGKRAEGLASYLTKGTRIYVEGETRTRSWEGGDGQRRYRTEVAASDVLLLGNDRDNVGDSHEEYLRDAERNRLPF
jgi:single-strand DNA-binding protein